LGNKRSRETHSASRNNVGVSARAGAIGKVIAYLGGTEQFEGSAGDGCHKSGDLNCSNTRVPTGGKGSERDGVRGEGVQTGGNVDAGACDIVHIENRRTAGRHHRHYLVTAGADGSIPSQVKAGVCWRGLGKRARGAGNAITKEAGQAGAAKAVDEICAGSIGAAIVSAVLAQALVPLRALNA